MIFVSLRFTPLCVCLFALICHSLRAGAAVTDILKRNTVNAPNGPIGIESDAKLNMGSRDSRRQLPIDQPKEASDLDVEIDADYLKLKDAMNKAKLIQGEPEYASEEYELNYEFPAWLSEMIRKSNSGKRTLESLGVQDLPDINACSKIKNMKEQTLCIIEALDQIKTVYERAKEINVLTSRILAGGRMASKALIRMKTLSSISENKHLIKALGTPMATLILIQRETTSDRDRWLAGSILTLLTDLPVVSDLADIRTGSFGHVNVIMPRQSRIREADRSILRIREGASPSNIINGFTTMDAEYMI